MQIVTFEYHVRAEDDIKCYMLWAGQCMRWYPSDTIDVLPHLFKMDKFRNQEFIDQNAKSLISKYSIPDVKFEQFYRAMCGIKYSEFPKTYKDEKV